MVVFVRPRRFGKPFVHTRCEPQITIGTMGVPDSRAMRAAPDLNSLSSKLRLIVASGNTPTSFAVPQRLHGCAVRVGTGGPVHGNVLHGPHPSGRTLVDEHLVLRHEADVPLDGAGGQPGVGEVHVAGVVDRDHRAPGRGDVLLAVTVNFSPGLRTLCGRRR